MSYNPRYRAAYNPNRQKRRELQQKKYQSRNSFRNRIGRRIRESVTEVVSFFSSQAVSLEASGRQFLERFHAPVEETVPEIILDEPTEIISEAAQSLLGEITDTMAYGNLQENKRLTIEAWDNGISADLTVKADIAGIRQWTEVYRAGLERR